MSVSSMVVFCSSCNSQKGSLEVTGAISLVPRPLPCFSVLQATGHSSYVLT